MACLLETKIMVIAGMIVTDKDDARQIGMFTSATLEGLVTAWSYTLSVPPPECIFLERGSAAAHFYYPVVDFLVD